MAKHTKVYGVCENKCLVPVYSKEQTDTNYIKQSEKSAEGKRFNCIPMIGLDGVMEIGKYIDFHNTSNAVNDYDARISFDGTNISFDKEIVVNGTKIKSTLNGKANANHSHDVLVSSDGIGKVHLWKYENGGYKVEPANGQKLILGSNNIPLEQVTTKAVNVTEKKITCKPTYDGTSTYAPNVYIGTTGIFSRSTNTSSKTIKHDIKALEENTSLSAENLYNVEVVQFKYNEGIITDENDSRYNKDLVGFIIEDLNEVYPIAIDKPSGNVKEWSWNSQYLIPPMLKLIQDQKKEIDELKKEISEIKGMLKK